MKLALFALILLFVVRPGQNDWDGILPSKGCNVTTHNGIGVWNYLLEYCDIKDIDSVTMPACYIAFRTRTERVYPLELEHICHSELEMDLAPCVQMCRSAVLKIFCEESLADAARLNEGSIGSFSFDETGHYVFSLPYENSEGICGKGIPAKLKELRARYDRFVSYRKDCIDNLTNQCKNASHSKRVEIPKTCADGETNMKPNRPDNNLKLFCIYHGFIKDEPNGGYYKYCEDCSNLIVGCVKNRC